MPCQFPPIPRLPHLTPTVAAICRYCGAHYSLALGCRFCSNIQVARNGIESRHPGTGLQHQNLVKLAGHLVSGLKHGFITARIGGFHPTRDELSRALEMAVEEFSSIGYVLREEPNGSMTELKKEKE